MQTITAYRKREQEVREEFLHLLELHQQLLEAKNLLIPHSRRHDPTALTGVTEGTHSVAQLQEQISTLKAGRILEDLARDDSEKGATNEPGSANGLAAEPDAGKAESTIPPPEGEGEPSQEGEPQR